jgi:endoglucanase
VALTLSPLLLVLLSAAPAGPPTVDIKVDQVGYPLDAPKLAFVVADGDAAHFVVRKAGPGAVVFEGELSAPVADVDTGDHVRVADFSKLKQTRAFYLDVPGVGRSWGFSVGPRPYQRPLYLSMRSFYGQRCGTAVDLGTPDFLNEVRWNLDWMLSMQDTTGASGRNRRPRSSPAS